MVSPISEPFASPDGYYSQVFERGVLEYLPNKVWTVEPFVRPMAVGRILIGDRASGFGPLAGRKRLASGDRSPGMRPLPADAPQVQAAQAEGGTYDDATGHTIGGEFLDLVHAPRRRLLSRLPAL